MTNILNAVDESGNEVLTSILDPFFLTLLPAFLNQAEEIKIRANRVNLVDVIAEYQKDGQIVILTPSENFHPFITSSRIRIMSGMTIEPDKLQKGQMRVQFKKEIITVDVQIELHENWETLRLIPKWQTRR